jgi:hypothetical protein
MSLQVVEQLNSRSVSRTQGKLRGTRVFHVFDDTTPLTTPNEVSSLFGAGGLPYYGEPFPGTSGLGAIDWNIELADGHRDLWIVTWQYQEVAGGGVQPPGPDEVTDPAAPGYIEVNATLSAAHVDIWRALNRATMDANSLPNSTAHPLGVPDARDIRGTHVDSAGYPVSFILRQFELNITLVREGKFDIQKMLAFVWKRNSTAFLTCPAGSLIYCGCSANRIGERKFQYNHKFIFDEWYHMRQSPGRRADGEIYLANHPQVSGIKVAEYVRFIQPFPDLTELRSIDTLFSKVT